MRTESAELCGKCKETPYIITNKKFWESRKKWYLLHIAVEVEI